MAITVVIIVPVISGSIPKEGFAFKGASLVLKTSDIGTCEKNLAASVIKVATIPNVAATDTNAISKKNRGIILSVVFFFFDTFSCINCLIFVLSSIFSPLIFKSTAQKIPR
jgi:hypothetical protein